MDSSTSKYILSAADMTAAEVEIAKMPPEPQFELQTILTRIRECRVAGQFEEAEDYCRQILAHDPNNTEAQQLMWALCIEGGDYQEATSWYRQIDRLNGSAHVNMHDTMVEEVFKGTLLGGITEDPAPRAPIRVPVWQASDFAPSSAESIHVSTRQESDSLFVSAESASLLPSQEPVIPTSAEPTPIPAQKHRQSSPLPVVIHPIPSQNTKQASRRPWWMAGAAVLVLLLALLASWQVYVRLSARYHADTHRSTPMGSPTATGQLVATKHQTTPPTAQRTMVLPPVARLTVPLAGRTSGPATTRLPAQGFAVPSPTEPAVHTGVISVIQVPPLNPISAPSPATRQASIQVSSTPAGADVFLDGRNTGRQTPCTLQVALGQTMTGSATVALEMTGYQRDERAVPVDAGKPAAVQFTLSRAPYQLAVNSTPGGGEIYVDGRDAGRQTPSTLTIDAGDHPTRDVTIAVELPGYARVERKLTLGNGNAPTIALAFGPPLGMPSTPAPAPAPVPVPAPGLPAGTRAGEVRTNPKDGAALVWVPAGEFLMGSASTDHLASKDETPQRRVMLAGYWIYRSEVTVTQFRAFMTAAGYAFDWTARKPPWGWSDSLPMVNVTWRDARAYAAWAGGSLPTEAQWEKAARGTDGRLYPWGNAWSATACNTSEKGLNRPMPVGSYPAGASPYGAQDMAGNVGEWCADWYDHYSKATAPRNPIGPATGKWRILRGGSWRYTADGARCASRDYGSTAFYWLTAGFRCAIVP